MPRNRLLLIAAGALALALPARAADAPAYRTPPPVVANILTAPRVPRTAPAVSPDGARLLLPDNPSLIPIAVLAEPVAKLAGLEILPALMATRPQLKVATSGFRIVSIADGAMVRAKLPAGSRVGKLEWSARGDRIACVRYAPGGAELWIVEAASGDAKRLEGVKLNTVLGPQVEWLDGDSALLCAAVPDPPPTLPAADPLPGGPQLRVGSGKAAPQRTARDVLRTPDDQAGFVAMTTSQLVRVTVDGASPTKVGDPLMLADLQVSPDERYLLVERMLEPVPVGFPYYLFPARVEVKDPRGGKVAAVGDIPLNDRSAISSVARLGPRGWEWSLDGGSLWFFSWKDAPGADALKAIKDTTLAQPGTDRLMRLDAPFTGEARAVLESDMQYRAMWFTSEGKRLLLYDAYEPRRVLRLSWIDPAAPDQRRVLVTRSTEGVYDDPGRPLERDLRHQVALWSPKGDGAVYMAGDGFRKDGQRPFLDRLDLASGKPTRLFESEADHLEQAQALLAQDGKRFVTLRQSNREAPNYYARKAGEKKGRKLSDYDDPAPALTASQRFQFKFTRSDGVQLNAEAVLPADWKAGQRLPTIFWIYPNDYRSAAAASQNRRAPNRFPSQSPLNPEVLVTQGYAVVYPDLAIVGTNDQYVSELQKSAQGAVDECVRRGFCDPARIGVGGHSYGAFSTVNLLAHSDLFKAGSASEGAYNRTLTPFTFQAEERTLWEARDTYLQMSPFLYADQIKVPLLLLHDLDDTNVGTNPIQSERMYEALNGMGRTVALVMYPFEDHGPVARETVLDYWSRVIEWFDRYVKNTPGASSSGTGAGAQP